MQAAGAHDAALVFGDEYGVPRSRPAVPMTPCACARRYMEPACKQPVRMALAFVLGSAYGAARELGAALYDALRGFGGLTCALLLK